jgi:hypothetical protein
MRRSFAVPALLAGLSSSAALAEATDLEIIHQGVSVDRESHIASFSVTFNRTPDFVAIDHGQPDTFQYEIDADSTNLLQSFGVNEVDAVIRGGEIWEGRGIPVRQRSGVEDANSGGWGPVRALLPFELDNNTVTFTAPLDDLGDTDGSFRYRAFATENGATTSAVTGAVIPLPAAAIPGLVMLTGLAAARRLRRIPI